MSLEPGSSAWQTDVLPIRPNATGMHLNLVVYKVSVKFERRFSQNSLAIRTLRVEYVKGVLVSHEVSSPSEFPMS